MFSNHKVNQLFTTYIACCAPYTLHQRDVFLGPIGVWKTNWFRQNLVFFRKKMERTTLGNSVFYIMIIPELNLFTINIVFFSCFRTMEIFGPFVSNTYFICKYLFSNILGKSGLTLRNCPHINPPQLPLANIDKPRRHQ